MRATVAIDAGRSLPVSRFDRLGVITAIVGRLLVSVALGTGYFGGRGFVGRTLNIGVAVDATEHGSVNRVLKCVGVDVQTDLLAIDVFGHGGIVVARKAVFVGGLGTRFLGGKSAGNCANQNEKSNLQRQFFLAPGVHLPCPHS